MNVVISGLLLIASSFAALDSREPPRVKADDLQRLTGAQWAGTLTYLDYRKNTKVSIPSNLVVTRSGEGEPVWTFEFLYPDEPRANGKRTVTIERDGEALGGEAVVERTALPDGTLKVVTEKSGTDNDRPSLYRFTYLLSTKSFSIRKEVRHEGTAEFFERNQYNWKR